MKTASENMTCTSKQLFVLLNDLKEGKHAGECRIDDTLANQKLKETLQQDQFDLTANLLNRMDSPPSRVDFMPLHRLITEEEVDDVIHAVKGVLPTGQFTSGSYVGVFEAEIAAL
ncbi:hypothetical protein RSC3_04120 [Bacillus paralicheniformis]|nr:hypothetical protein RSC3_04120 [Bacillus paralicheniformis]